MNSSTVSLSTGPITADTITSLSALRYKGQTYITFDLTDLNETSHMVSTLDINWGDGTDTERYVRSLVIDYKKQSIFDEILYGKIGSVAIPYTHIYNTVVDASQITYRFNVVAYYENGYNHEFVGDIVIYPESFYDSVKDIKLISTQITPTADNYTVANFETNNGNTFITVLATEPIVTSLVPINISTPSILGNPWSGMILSASPGVWTSSPTQFLYQWVVNDENIVGANASTWVAVDILDQDIIQVIVIAVNLDGASAPSRSPPLVGFEAPYELSPPVISGIPIIENTLTTTVGTYGGTLSVKSIQWQRNSIDLPGETSSFLVLDNYTLDHGDEIVAKVSAVNIVSGIVAYPQPAYIVLDPEYVSGGFISGTIIPGQDIIATDPVWANDPTSVTREWYKNGVSTGNFTTIYANTVGGDSIYASFSASNIAGIDGPVMSNVIDIMEEPVNTVLPIIYGDNWNGGTMFVTTGSWTGSPISYEFAWYNNGVVVSGFNTSAFNVSDAGAEYNDVIYASVVAINEGGTSLSAASNTIGIDITPIFDHSNITYNLSAAQGMIRTSLVNMSVISDPSAATIQYNLSAATSTIRNALVALGDSPESSAGNMNYNLSAARGTMRYAEVFIPDQSVSIATIQYNLSAAKSSII